MVDTRQVKEINDLPRSSVHQPGNSLPSLDAPGDQFRSPAEASRSSAASLVPTEHVPSGPST
jgi:hypothetical protein